MLFKKRTARDDDQSFMSPFWDTMKFHWYRAEGHLFRYLRNRFFWNVGSRHNMVTKFPEHVDLEACSSCNMRCPMCYTTTQQFKSEVVHTIMDFDLYKKIIDECVSHDCFSIRLSWRGESTLHPKLLDMIEYAKTNGIKEVSMLTNALKLTPEMFEKMVDLGMDWVTISFDGMGETYNRIRKPAKFEDQVAKIKEFYAIKKRKKSHKPVLKIQAIWPSVKDSPKTFYELFKDYVDQVAVNPLLDFLHKDHEIQYRENFTCPVLWQRMTVSADGKICMCVHDEYNSHVFGNAQTDSLYDVWHGPKMSKAREAQLNHLGVEGYKACSECFLPRKTVTTTEKIGDKEMVMEKLVDRPEVVGQ